MSRLSKTATVLLLVLTLGWHWALLQSVAWVSMIVRYSQHASFSTAISMTFDGAHPCFLCEFVADGRKSDQDPEQKYQLKVLRLEFVVERATPFIFQDFDPGPSQPALTVAARRLEKPPSPPPRLA